MRQLWVACALCVVLLFAVLPASADLAAVWAVDDGEKVFQDNVTHPLKAGGGDNSVWNGSTVSLFAARNETVAFQLILEADVSGAAQCDVHVTSLANGAATIRGSHPLLPPNDYLGLGVELFTEHYFDISTPSWNSICGGFYWTGEANPHITGKIPDALVPFSALPGKGGAPFDIGASLNQGVWADIYVPRAGAPGIYSGTITVSVQGSPVAAIPLELEVLDITLSDQNHYKSMVFYCRESILERHDTGYCTPEMWDMVLEYHRMAHRHRLELIGCGDWTETEPLKGTLTGEAFTAAHNYDGPGEGVGNSLFTVNTYGVQFQDDEASYRTDSDNWVNWFTANAPADIEYFLYLCDEPGPDMYPWIQERASWIHNNPGPGQNLPVFMTRAPIDSLIGSIDIWCCQAPSYYPDDVAAAQARGERVWLYAGNRPQTPADATDEYGIAFRLKPWIAHYCGIARWFTWESTHYYNNRNEIDPDGRKNVWVNPITFSEDMGDGVPCPAGTGNGDGVLFYPGEDALFPEEDRSYPGPASSIRMKMYRRGIQDVEYMWLAEQSGHASEVQLLLADMLPGVMWDAQAVPTWSNANADYEAARRQLANLIAPLEEFPDVAPGHWAYDEIMACFNANSVKGYDDGLYHPEYEVTRDQMAVYVARALVSPSGDAAIPDPTPPPAFSDVPPIHWAYKHIEYAVSQNVVQGYEDGTYGPDIALDRGQMAVFIARAMVAPGGDDALPDPDPPATFLDVSDTFWAYKHVEYCVGQDVVKGYDDGLYHPDYPCTRDQMAVYIARAFGLL
ncbi:MAG: S-layer homology domain-containing protein [Thermoleophilia bacterium]|nr:S-layer homology domain-containing protein [Thermoleophilia bacterium]